MPEVVVGAYGAVMAATLPQAPSECCDPCIGSSTVSLSIGIGTLTGVSNPNEVVTGIVGQVYTQVVGAEVTVWTNTNGGTAWV